MANGAAGELLLGPGDPDPVLIENEAGASPFVLTCDHAGQAVPRRLGDLGVTADDLARHIGWDIGVLGVSRRLAALLDAALIGQAYSRLVIDCNRRPGLASSILPVADLTPVPGNEGLDEAAARARAEEIFAPYHAAIAAALDARAARRRPTLLVAMHSFTPMLRRTGEPRPWHIGLLFNRDDRLARALVARLEAEGDLCVGENEPYAVSDEGDYGIPVHGEGRGLPHVEIELRQDLIADAAGQARWAERLARLLPLAARDAGLDGG